MFNKTKLSYYKLGAALTAGVMVGSSSAAFAAAGNNFSSIASNINTSIVDLPGLISALAYLFGVLLMVLGIMKIKDHVENPSQTHLKDGAIRLLAGGALFALPIVMEAAFNTSGTGTGASTAKLKALDMTTS